MKRICANCANACHINCNDAPNLEVLFCSRWVETMNKNNGCSDFVEQPKVNYCFVQDFKTRRIVKRHYPTMQPYNPKIL